MRRTRWLVLVTLFAAGAISFSCGSDSTAPADAPEGHTVVRGGVAHAPGLTNPTQNCTSCHGANLAGGSAGQPSCFSCHGQKW